MPIGVLSSYGISFNQVEYFLAICYPEKTSSLEEGKKQKK